MNNVLCRCFSLFLACLFILCVGTACNKKTITENSSEVKTSFEQEENDDSSLNGESSEETVDVPLEIVTEEDEEENYLEYYRFRVQNGATPIMTNYRGMSGTVYNPSSFVMNDTSGRKYTTDMIDLEVSRLKDAGMRYMRCRYDSRWAWDTQINGWDFDSTRMKCFWNYCDAMNKIGAEIILNPHSSDYYLNGGANSIKEADYLGGFDTDRYSESKTYASCVPQKLMKSGKELSAGEKNYRGETETVTEYYQRIAKSALRYGYFYGKTLQEAKARGVNNIKYILYFTEPSSCYGLGEDEQMGKTANEYLLVVRTIKNVLDKMGVASWVKHIGPNQYTPEGNGLMKYCLQKDKDLFDVLSVHQYNVQEDATSESFYWTYDSYFSSYSQTIKDFGVQGSKELWLDEYGSHTTWFAKNGANATPLHGLQQVAGGLAAQKYGIQNIVLWQLCSQLWTDEVFTNDEFENGIHSVGVIPSLYTSATPYGAYYTQSLFTRYNGYKKGTVYPSNGDEYGIVFFGSVMAEDGTWTVTVLNLDVMESKVLIEFDKPINQTLFRHSQAANEVEPTSAAHLASIDKVFEGVKFAFADTVAPYSVAIYTGLKF